jgi:DNA-binding CsgD family transcriptional regulator
MLLETLPPKTHEAPGAGHVEHEPASSQTVVPAALLATALDGLGIVLCVVDSHGRVVASTQAAASAPACRAAVAALSPALVKRARLEGRPVGQAAEGEQGAQTWLVATPMDVPTAPGEFFSVQAIDAQGPHQVAPSLLSELCGLTPAEAQVARFVADGLSPKLMARRLGISLATVKTHLHRGFRKTGSRGQADLVRRVARIAPQRPAV